VRRLNLLKASGLSAGIVLGRVIRIMIVGRILVAVLTIDRMWCVSFAAVKVGIMSNILNIGEVVA